MVRSKAHRRRAVASFTWTLGGGLTCACKMYQMLQPQGIPPAAHLHARNQAEVKMVGGWEGGRGAWAGLLQAQAASLPCPGETR